MQRQLKKKPTMRRRWSRTAPSQASHKALEAICPTRARAVRRLPKLTGCMHSYTAYGLGIHSTLPLPELVEAEAPADVVVWLRRVDYPLDQVSPLGTRYHAAPDEM